MRKKLLSLGLLVSAISFAQTECCNVVDSEGVAVVSSNGNCVVAENIPSFDKDCGEVAKVMPIKKELEASERAILTRALEGVKFKSNSDVLLSNSLPKLDAVAELMLAHKDYNLTIDGYTDSTGNDDHNQKLSYKRAEAAKARLVKDGVAGSRITTHGYGEINPVATNETVAGRAKNRRVEFLISF